MIKPLVDLKEWCETYKLDPKPRQCLKCKKDFPLDIPVAIKGYRGLQMADHGCGYQYQRTTFSPWDKKEKEFWLRITGRL